jgi:hypothetical protein
VVRGAVLLFHERCLLVDAWHGVHTTVGTGIPVPGLS